MTPTMLKGHLDTLLLAVLEPGPLHGYAVAERLRARSGGALDLPSGTIYPALHRLERLRLVAGDWEVQRSRRRRSYTLTVAGRRALAARRSEWRGFADVVEQVIAAPAGGAPASGGPANAGSAAPA